jgi:hypothetical protein
MRPWPTRPWQGPLRAAGRPAPPGLTATPVREQRASCSRTTRATCTTVHRTWLVWAEGPVKRRAQQTTHPTCRVVWCRMAGLERKVSAARKSQTASLSSFSFYQVLHYTKCFGPVQSLSCCFTCQRVTCGRVDAVVGRALLAVSRRILLRSIRQD